MAAAPSQGKTDRSGAYMGRYIAKNLVASGICDTCEIQVAYAIGVVDPVSTLVDTAGSAKVPEERSEEVVRQLFDLRPQAILQQLDLLRPIYRQTAAYGHFGRELPEFTSEKTDRVTDSRRLA